VIPVRSKTIELANPIMDGPRKVEVLTLSAPTIGARRRAEFHLKNGTQGDAGTKFQVALVAQCSGLTDPVVEQLDMDVFNEAWEFLAAFLVYAPETTSPTP
jgi:hypothetical protein